MQDPENDNKWRILIATDNHLGFKERDPIRQNDSFEAFDEILRIAVERNVDFVLLGGDLFHENMPTRATLHKTIEIIRKYSFGNLTGPRKWRILTDEKLHFHDAPHANISDPHVKVKLPIFSIHGNHDDPGEGSLAALDLLHISSLINYFGKTEVADELLIKPLVMQKGESTIALYGIGSLGEQRAARMFAKNQILFADYKDVLQAQSGPHTSLSSSFTHLDFPPPSQFSATNSNNSVSINELDPFKILILHQNRSPHSANNHVQEKNIRGLFDFVLWGHEHESIVMDLKQTIMDDNRRSTFISQPGSSVATSLALGESQQKHVALLEVHKSQCKITPIKLRSIRPLVFKDLRLSDGIPPHLVSEKEREAHITSYLTNNVEQILQDIARATNEDPSAVANKNFTYYNSKLPLIRIRVEYTGYESINVKRFGTQYLDRVANPDELLLFYHESKPKASSRGMATTVSNISSIQLAAQHQDIASVLDQHLSTLLDGFSFLPKLPMIQSLHDFAKNTDEKKVFKDSVEKYINEAVHHLSTSTYVHSDDAVKQKLKRFKEAKDAQALLASSTTSSTVPNELQLLENDFNNRMETDSANGMEPSEEEQSLQDSPPFDLYDSGPETVPNSIQRGETAIKNDPSSFLATTFQEPIPEITSPTVGRTKRPRASSKATTSKNSPSATKTSNNPVSTPPATPGPSISAKSSAFKPAQSAASPASVSSTPSRPKFDAPLLSGIKDDPSNTIILDDDDDLPTPTPSKRPKIKTDERRVTSYSEIDFITPKKTSIQLNSLINDGNTPEPSQPSVPLSSQGSIKRSASRSNKNKVMIEDSDDEKEDTSKTMPQVRHFGWLPK